MLLTARDGFQRKKEEKNTTQIRVIPGPFKMVLLGNHIKPEETGWQSFHSKKVYCT